MRIIKKKHYLKQCTQKKKTIKISLPTNGKYFHDDPIRGKRLGPGISDNVLIRLFQWAENDVANIFV